MRILAEEFPSKNKKNLLFFALPDRPKRGVEMPRRSFEEKNWREIGEDMGRRRKGGEMMEK